MPILLGGKFRQYDYGWENIFKYHQFHPPEYNLKKIKVPVLLHYGANDWLANVNVRIFLYTIIHPILNISDIFAKIFTRILHAHIGFHIFLDGISILKILEILKLNELLNMTLYKWFTLYLYYPQDVHQLSKDLGNTYGEFLVPHEYFNHLDFMWAKDVKELLYDKILSLMTHF